MSKTDEQTSLTADERERIEADPTLTVRDVLAFREGGDE